jgi:septum site-determining protein MinC
MALVLTPEPPIMDWLADIDQKAGEVRTFIAGWPAVLDLSAVTLSNSAIAQLVNELEKRGIRIMGVENIDQSQVGANLPPLIRASRAAGAEQSVVAAPPVQETRPEPSALLVDKPVRSGQAVVFMDGDVTVLGSVGSGAEVVAGGSIHIYGTLRGRAMAGANGNTSARIYCSKIEAELLSISGYYLTADWLDQSQRGRPSQVWLDGNALRVAALD